MPEVPVASERSDADSGGQGGRSDGATAVVDREGDEESAPGAVVTEDDGDLDTSTSADEGTEGTDTSGEIDDTGGGSADKGGFDDADDASFPAPLRTSSRRYALLLLIPLLVGFALRLGLAVTDNVITNDASAYLESGRNLVDGRGFTRDGGFPELHFPPGAAVVLGGAWKLTGSPLFAVSSVNMIFAFLALFPLAGLARRVGGDRAGLAACWIGALAPGISVVPATAGGGSETLYVTLLLVMLWLVATLRDRKGWTLWLTAVLAGLAAGAMYLTRPEGILLVFVIVATMVLWSGVVGDLRKRDLSLRRLVRQLGPPAVLFFVFLGCMAPYVGYLHAHTGKWQPTAKSQDVNIKAWRAVAGGDRRARDEELYRLDETGLHFIPGESSLVTLARQDPGQYAGIVGTNLAELRSQYIDPRASRPTPFPRWSLLPLPITALALWAAWKNRGKPTIPVLIGVVVLATATCIGFFVQARYLIPTVGVVCALAGLGMVQLRPNWRKWAFYGSLVLLVVPLLIDVTWQKGVFNSKEPVEHQIAGDWIDQNTPIGSRIMTRSLVTEFYSARQGVAMPYGSIDETVRFAYHHGVDYIVLDEYLMRRFRPQLMPLFKEGPFPRLKLEHEFTHDGRLTRIFSLDPPPPVDSKDPPTLGFVGDG